MCDDAQALVEAEQDAAGGEAMSGIHSGRVILEPAVAVAGESAHWSSWDSSWGQLGALPRSSC